MTVAPPVIRGRVPDGYRGRVFYRLETFSYEGAMRTVFPTVVKLVDQKLAQLCRNGVDRSKGEFRELPPSHGLNSAAAALPPWSVQAFAVSSKSGGRRQFLHSDRRTDGSGTVRLYVLIIGVAPARTALAMEANGIEHTVSDQGAPVFRLPDWLGWGREQFGYFDLQVVDGHALVHATGSLIVFSEELVRRLGNVLPKCNAFVPRGVAER